MAETEKALDRLAQLCQRIIEAAMGLTANKMSLSNVGQSGGNGVTGSPAIPPGDSLTETE